MNDLLIHLLEYECWANRRVIDALDTMENPPARAITLMSHLLAAQQIWIGRLIHESVPVVLWEDIPVSWMGETAERHHRKLVSYAASLSATDLVLPIEYTNTKGQVYHSTPTDILAHLCHHSAYHRGQIVQLIRPLLPEAPVTDFIVWTRE